MGFVSEDPDTPANESASAPCRQAQNLEGLLLNVQKGLQLGSLDHLLPGMWTSRGGEGEHLIPTSQAAGKHPVSVNLFPSLLAMPPRVPFKINK